MWVSRPVAFLSLFGTSVAGLGTGYMAKDQLCPPMVVYITPDSLQNQFSHRDQFPRGGNQPTFDLDPGIILRSPQGGHSPQATFIPNWNGPELGNPIPFDGAISEGQNDNLLSSDGKPITLEQLKRLMPQDRNLRDREF